MSVIIIGSKDRKLLKRILKNQEELMATVADLTAAVQAVSDGLTALGTSLTAEIAKLDAEIQAAGQGGIDPTKLDPIVTSLQGIATSIGNLKTQADGAT